MKTRRKMSLWVLLAGMILVALAGCSAAPVAVIRPGEDAVISIPEPTEPDDVAAPGVDPDPSEPAQPAPPTSEPGTDPGAGEPAADAGTEVDVTADWPIFRDEVYGFSMAYPPEWGFMDIPVYDPGAGGPPTVIERFVIFFPQEWEEQLRPGDVPDPNNTAYPALSIDVTLGTLEEYRREFMELGASETLQINGLSVLYERDTYDDHNIAQYTFQHPTGDDLRVRVADTVTGFAARAEERPDVVPLIPLVVSTFRFTE